MIADTDFSGKTVLVVGGSAGIGNAAAQAFRAPSDLYLQYSHEADRTAAARAARPSGRVTPTSSRRPRTSPWSTRDP